MKQMEPRRPGKAGRLGVAQFHVPPGLWVQRGGAKERGPSPQSLGWPSGPSGPWGRVSPLEDSLQEEAVWDLADISRLCKEAAEGDGLRKGINRSKSMEAFSVCSPEEGS